MRLQNCAHIFSTAIGQFDGVFITYSIEHGPWLEVFFYKGKELLSYVGLHAFTKWRVEPYDLPFTSSSVSRGAARFLIGQLVGVSAVRQSFLIHN